MVSGLILQIIASVENNSPSFKAGLKPGDIILKFDGTDIKKDRDLPRVVASTKVGKNVELEIWRGNKIIKLKVKLGELETFEKINKAETKKEGSKNKDETLGIQLTSITQDVRMRFNIPRNVNGVLILKVERNSVAAERGLKAGDVILAIVDNDKSSQNHIKVSSPIEVINRVKQLKKEGKKIVLLYIQHLNSTPGYVPLKIQD